MNYINDYKSMDFLTTMFSNSKLYKENYEMFITDIIALIERLVPIMVDERISEYQFDISVIENGLKKMFQY